MKEPTLPPGKDGRDDEKKRQEQNRRRIHFAITYLIASTLVLWLFPLLFLNQAARTSEIPYSEFKQKLAAGLVADATIGERSIVGDLKNPQQGKSPATVPFNTVPAPGGDPQLIEQLQSANVTYHFERPSNPVGGILIANVLPLLLLGAFWYMAYRGAGAAAGGMGGVFGVGKSKAIAVKPEDVTVTYKDVGGADEAIAELQEIIQFLKAPEKFAQEQLVKRICAAQNDELDILSVQNIGDSEQRRFLSQRCQRRCIGADGVVLAAGRFAEVAV